MLDGIRTLEELDLEHKRVLIRVDWNVPIQGDMVTDDASIRRSLPTLRNALDRGARVIVASHLGEGDKAPTLEPVGARVCELTGWEVHLPEDATGDGPKKLIGDLRPGQIVLLENLSSDPGENRDGDRFARALSELCDVFVNDAFACSLDERASVRTLPRLVRERGCGLSFASELGALGRLVTAPDKPFIVLLGGDDVLGAVDLATSLLGRADVLLIGGGVANTFVAAMGERVGASAVQRDALALVRTLLEKARDAKVKVLLPTDVVVAGSPSDAAGRPTSYGTIAPPEIALDIGPATLESFSKALLGAGTILVTGPMGFADNPAFAKGTRAMADAVANAAGYTVAVGDGATAVTRAGDEIAARLGHVSKGGRAAVALVSGKKLPGVEALRGA